MVRLAVLAWTALLLLAPATGDAHEDRSLGRLRLRVGWLHEPALAGFLNAVQVVASDGRGPVGDGDIRVELIFGRRRSGERSLPLDLIPDPGRPGEYRAAAIPTRPGVYTFRVFGNLGGEPELDAFFTSGEETFSDVLDPAEAQFPVRDPTSGELADRLERLSRRVDAARSAAEAAAEAADSTAGSARTIALVALGLGALGAAGWLRRPRGTR